MDYKIYVIIIFVLTGILFLLLSEQFRENGSLQTFQQEEIIDKLNLEQKIGQLFIVGINGKTITPETENFIKKFHPGGILLLGKNIENKDQLISLIQEIQKISLEDSGLPLFIAVDQEGGEISRIGWVEKTSQSKIKNPEQAYNIGLQRGKELKELGINLNLAPLLDFCRKEDFLWGRSFQKNSETIGGLGKFLISGQKTAGVLTAIKHFPGYGGISFHPEEILATASESPEISQFQTAMESGPEMAMTANVIYEEIDPDLPFVFSLKGINFLKQKLGDKILIISDDLSQNSLLNKFPLEQIVVFPIKAGVDIMIFSGWRVPAEQGLLEFQKASEKGIISDDRINQAVSRIIKLKEKLLQ